MMLSVVHGCTGGAFDGMEKTLNIFLHLAVGYTLAFSNRQNFIFTGSNTSELE